MKVWILTREVHYDDSCILDVYDTQENCEIGAEEYIEAMKEEEDTSSTGTRTYFVRTEDDCWEEHFCWTLGDTNYDDIHADLRMREYEVSSNGS